MEKSRFESTHEFFALWLKTYEATYGRLIEMPAMGPLREKSEKLMKNFSVSVNLYAAWMESLVNFQSVFIEAMRRMHEKTAEMEEKAGTKDFYNIWIETYSETFKEFLKSGHFSHDMGALMSQYIEYQKVNREMLEENYLKPTGLPTRTEIDEINREVYSLRKTVKELRNQMKESGSKGHGQS
jgi:ABC-type transporter lipoprotein component MlaA